jgi:hypothetical protein
MQGMAFIAQLTAGAVSKWETAMAVVTLGSGSGVRPVKSAATF